jgi:hypothetical protein
VLLLHCGRQTRPAAQGLGLSNQKAYQSQRAEGLQTRTMQPGMLTSNAGKNLLSPGHLKPKMIEQVSEPYAGKLARTLPKGSDPLGLPNVTPAGGGQGPVGCAVEAAAGVSIKIS